MSIDRIPSIDASRPFLDERLRMTRLIKTWVLLVREYILRFGGWSTYSPEPFLLEDGEETSLETGRAGFGSVIIGDRIEAADFLFSSSGTITLKWQTTNVAATDTPSTLSIYYDVTNSTVNIKNNLGSDYNISLFVKYNIV